MTTGTQSTRAQREQERRGAEGKLPLGALRWNGISPKTRLCAPKCRGASPCWHPWVAPTGSRLVTLTGPQQHPWMLGGTHRLSVAPQVLDNTHRSPVAPMGLQWHPQVLDNTHRSPVGGTYSPSVAPMSPQWHPWVPGWWHPQVLNDTHRILVGDTIRSSMTPTVPQWHPWVSNGTHGSLATPIGTQLVTLTGPQ